jgi:hypothetical protein
VSHTYAWDWEPDTIAFYIDNCQVWQTPTPQDGSYTSNPMFLFLLTGANYIGNGDPDPSALTGYHALVTNVTVYACGSTLTGHLCQRTGRVSQREALASHYSSPRRSPWCVTLTRHFDTRQHSPLVYRRYHGCYLRQPGSIEFIRKKRSWIG